jgi:transmembrane sensor
MTPQDHIPHKLFSKFFTGEITEKEQSELDAFISTDPDNEKIFHEYERIWSCDTSDIRFNDRIEKALDNVKANVDDQSIKPLKSNTRLWMRIAASIVIFLGLSYLAYTLFPSDKNQFLLLNSGNDIITKELSDGTIVWLNKNTTLYYPENFSKTTRVVKLIGEAYFTVKHDLKHPFIVKTGNTETRVLGTEFNLKAPENENWIELILTKGKVKFTDTKSGRQETLTLNEKLVFDLNTKEIITSKFTDLNAIGWKTGEINLDNLSLGEISKVLTNTYGKEIIVEKSLKNLVYHQTLPFKNMSLNEILNILQLTLNIQIDTTGSTVIIK